MKLLNTLDLGQNSIVNVKNSPWLNVLDYGVKGDGSTDDTVGFMSAFADLQSAKKGVLVIPGGLTYYLDTQQTSPYTYIDGPNLILSGAHDCLIIAFGAKFTVGNSANYSDIILFDQCNNVEWVGGHFVGNNTGLASGNNNGAIAVENCIRLYIHDVETDGFQGSHLVGDWIFKSRFERIYCHGGITAGNGIDLSFMQDVDIVDCYVESTNGAEAGFSQFYDSVAASGNKTGLTLRRGTTNNLTIKGCEFTGFQTGLSLKDLVDSTVDDCDVVGNSSTTTQYYWGVLLSATTGSVDTDNITIKNTRINGNGTTATSPQGAGIAIDPNGYTLSRLYIKDSEIFDNSNAGISLRSAGTGLQLEVWNTGFYNQATSNQTTQIANEGFASHLVVKNCLGINPAGLQTAPSVPSSGGNATNSFPYMCRVYVAGGSGVNVTINGTDTGVANGEFTLDVGDQIGMTYTTAPTWTWFGL